MRGKNYKLKLFALVCAVIFAAGLAGTGAVAAAKTESPASSKTEAAAPAASTASSNSAAQDTSEETTADAISYPLTLTMRLRSLDGSILASFMPSGEVDHYTVEVAGSKPVTIAGTETVYSFTAGSHGKAYTFTITGFDGNGTPLCVGQDTALFLNYKNLPNLPLLTITTEDGVNPSCDVLYPPLSGMVGMTIQNAEYVKADITATGLSSSPINASGKIKVRGNTSANVDGKKPYKIKFSEKIDLLGDGKPDKEYVLLSTGTDLNTYIGNYIASRVGMEYVPKVRFVNVMLNGDWCGLYVLTETVEEGSARVKLDDSGFLIENDAYWWGEEVCFRTKQQPVALGYTLKYPEVSGSSSVNVTSAAVRSGVFGTNDKKVTAIQQYMQKIDDMASSGNKKILQYIDSDSYAGWLLARDILGQSDPSGSNMYYTKYSYNSKNPTATPLKMGPLWDFDSSFTYVDQWSSQHSFTPLHFTELLSMKEFAGVYINKWLSLSPTLVSDINAYLDALEKSQGKAIDESRVLNNARWNQGYDKLSDEIARDKQFFAERTAWLDAHMGEIQTGATK